MVFIFLTFMAFVKFVCFLLNPIQEKIEELHNLFGHFLGNA